MIENIAQVLEVISKIVILILIFAAIGFIVSVIVSAFIIGYSILLIIIWVGNWMERRRSNRCYHKSNTLFTWFEKLKRCILQTIRKISDLHRQSIESIQKMFSLPRFNQRKQQQARTDDKQQKALKNMQPVDIQWKKILITENDIVYLKTLSTKQLLEQVKPDECKIAQGKQGMKQPAEMNNNFQKPTCGSKRTTIDPRIQDGQFFLIADKGMQTLRKHIKIIGDSMNPQLKSQLESIVKDCFGSDYKI